MTAIDARGGQSVALFPGATSSGVGAPRAIAPWIRGWLGGNAATLLEARRSRTDR